jgi:hypothetical protein
LLLDRWLPEFDVSKRHTISIAAPADRIYEEVLRYDFGRSRVTGALMALRGYGLRRRRAAAAGPASFRDRLTRFGFTLLEEKPGEELVFGLVGRFWRFDGGLLCLTPEEFAAFREPGFAKAAWNVRVGGSGLHLPHSELSTETRVLCLGDDARRRFLRYWKVVEPFSGAIRWSLLRGVKKNSLSPRAG